METASSPTPQADEQHLRWLAIAYYVTAVLAGAGALLGLLGAALAALSGIALGVGQVAMGESAWWAAPGVLLGFLLLVMFTFIALVIGLDCLTAASLLDRKRWTFCVVMALLSTLSFPVGTILGVLTLVVLLRPSVRSSFGQPPVLSIPGNVGVSHP